MLSDGLGNRGIIKKNCVSLLYLLLQKDFVVEAVIGSCMYKTNKQITKSHLNQKFKPFLTFHKEIDNMYL